MPQPERQDNPGPVSVEWLTGPLTDVHDGHHLHLHADTSVTCSCGRERAVDLLSLPQCTVHTGECMQCGQVGVMGLAVPEVGAASPSLPGDGGRGSVPGGLVVGPDGADSAPVVLAEGESVVWAHGTATGLLLTTEDGQPVDRSGLLGP